MRDAKTKETVCKKCSWKNIFETCPYEHCLNEDNTYCSVAEDYKTNYWKKKDRDEKQSQLLGKLVIENNIKPKYKLGDKVWKIERYIGSSECAVEKIIRKIVVNNDGKSYCYQVKGHTLYTFAEDELYSTEADAMKVIVSNFIKNTQKEIERLSKECKTLGVDINSQVKGLLETKKD